MLSRIALLVLVLALSAPWVQAASPKPDVRLLIDNSGSMIKSDPDNMRATALTLIVRLLPEGSRAGVWLFGDKVTPLVSHRLVDDAWRAEALAAIAQIDNSGQRTNIPAALDAVLNQGLRLDPRFRTNVVLLTDGRVDVSPSPMANAKATEELLQRRAPAFGATGVPIHTIALSDDADWDVLQTLARTTRASADKAQSAEQLTAIYLEVLDRVAPPERVPMEGSSFSIDDRVSEFTALAFLQRGDAQTRLVSPGGTVYDADSKAKNISWFGADQFSVVTVREPEAGTWRLEAASDAHLQVTVISDLGLAVEPLPGSVPVGQVVELAVSVNEQDKPITDPEVLKLLTVQALITTPTNDTVTIKLSDAARSTSGEYRVPLNLFDQAGRYQILVQALGKTLARELPLSMDVYQAPATAEEITTRDQDFGTASLRKPVLYGAVGLFVLILLLLLNARRRSKKRLAQWQKRVNAAANDDTMPGFSADDDRN